MENLHVTRNILEYGSGKVKATPIPIVEFPEGSATAEGLYELIEIAKRINGFVEETIDKIGPTGYLEYINGNKFGTDAYGRKYIAINAKVIEVTGPTGKTTKLPGSAQFGEILPIVVFQRYAESNYPLVSGGGGRNQVQDLTVGGTALKRQHIGFLYELLIKGEVTVPSSNYDGSITGTVRIKLVD